MHVNYSETLQYLYDQLPMFQRIGPAAIKKDLTNTIALCEALGNPQDQLTCIHIAGTNGKGSVANMLSAVMTASGRKTGLYTSPHLIDFRGRIRVDGVPCSEVFVVDFVDTWKDQIKSIQPSFFEITVAMAFAYFREKQCDICIIETGLGGRLDSTNIIQPVISVITNIGWDHMALLGDTLPQIAGEKAGIIKSGIPVVIGEYQSDVEQVFRQKAASEDTSLFYARELVSIDVVSQDPGQLKIAYTSWLDEQVHELSSSLWGKFQHANINTVLATLKLLQHEWPVSDDALSQGIAHVHLLTGFRGRMEVLGTSPLLVVDCAHNKDGIAALMEAVEPDTFEQVHVVFGAVQDKDVTPLLPLLPRHASYFLCRPDIPRGMQVDQLAQAFQHAELSAVICGSVDNAVQQAITDVGTAGLILICGSIFVAAEALPLLDKKKTYEE